MANSEKKENNPCPCGTGELYENCCERFYSGKSFPETAEELMRSRYCAYVMNQLDYLVQTTDPKTRDKNLKASLQTSMDQYEWLQLEIISTAMGQKNDKIAKVEFVARYKTKEGLSDHYEVSKFRKFEGHWVYTGTVDE
ncbi:MAG: SEC-C domain-containing protein [Lentisphaeria bacterium]|nr:SEC-C domain-containing protein [Lentisphaeria bacterium]